MNENVNKESELGLSVGLIVITNNDITIDCCLCSSQIEGSYLSNFFEHIKSERCYSNFSLKQNGPLSQSISSKEIKQELPDDDTSLEGKEGKTKFQLKNIVPTHISQKDAFRIDRKTLVIKHTSPTKEPNRCKYCTKTLNSREDLNVHLLNGTHTFHCPVCSATSHSLSDFKEHLLIHRSTYKCTYCPSSVKGLDRLKNHNIKEHIYICGFCNKAFRTDILLLRHTKLQHAIEKQKSSKLAPVEHNQFQCTDCAATFKSKSLCERHQRKDHPDQPYKCEHCSSVFSIKQNLMFHVIVAHKEVYKAK